MTGPARSGLRLPHVLGAAILVACILPAQRMIHEWSGTPQTREHDYFGSWIEVVGDLDQDGTADLAIGANGANVGSSIYAGRLHIFSGRSGKLLKLIEGTYAYESVGHCLALGDIDSDSIPDWLATTTAPDQNTRIHTFWSGKSMTPSLSWSAPPWIGVGRIGDVDKDGLMDLSVGDARYGFPPQQPYIGKVSLISLRTATTLVTHFGEGAYHGLAWAAQAGDVNADGTPDYLIRPGGFSPFRGPDLPRFYSGRTHRELFRIYPPEPSEAFAWGYCVAGDLNADGYDDFAASDLGRVVVPTRYRIYGFGGPDGRELFRVERPATGRRLGDWLARVGDVDGDAHDDLAVGGLGGQVYVFSGRDQSVLHAVVDTTNTLNFYQSYGTGDLDGDDFPDFVIPGFWDYVRKVARVRAFSGAPVGVATLGIGCATRAGVIPRIGASFTPEVGKLFAINLSRVEPLSSAQLVLGSSATTWNGTPLPLDLAGFGMPGCTLRTSIDAQFVRQAQGISHKGWSRVETTIPNDPRLRGATFYAQWLVFGQDAVGPYGVTTRALAVTIQ